MKVYILRYKSGEVVFLHCARVEFGNDSVRFYVENGELICALYYLSLSRNLREIGVRDWGTMDEFEPIWSHKGALVLVK